MLDFPFAIKVFMALFAIMNPIANVPVFLSFTRGIPIAAQRKVAAKVSLGVAIGCIVSAVAGGPLLQVFGLQVNDFRLAGGLLVLLIALSMLHGEASTQHASTDDESAAIAKADDVAVYPLTIPLLVGPGTIATLIVLGHTAAQDGHEIALALGLGAFLAVMACALMLAPTLNRYLSPKVTAIAQRLMGMILAAIAMQMMVQSLQAFFPKLV
ncbi:MarC family protein [Castellaniella hirudinis]|uniref:MarC family protein n=1 Tax=Castellaniella hirudinis TaxID=1144617 RepID=UPI0039C0E11F